jgi:hypothetical protein
MESNLWPWESNNQNFLTFRVQTQARYPRLESLINNILIVTINYILIINNINNYLYLIPRFQHIKQISRS